MEPNKNVELGLTCPLCGSPNLWVFYTLTNVPASCNRLWKNKDEAINCPKGDIKLAFCRSCTFVSNKAIDPKKNQYDVGYDNSLFYSPHFQEFARKLAFSIVEQYGLYGKNIVEIGGGKVDFLTLLVEIGKNCGLRFDPFQSKVEVILQKTNNSKSSVLKSFPFLNEGKKIDFIFSYHELEHMNEPKIFLENLRSLLGNSESVRIFFSVPNALKAFVEGDYSDIIYEHVSYFTVPSLYFLFSSSGFAISNVEETKAEIFDSLYVVAALKEDRARFEPDLNKVVQIEQSIKKFTTKTEENIKELCQRLVKLLDDGKRIVVWGAGARGVTFLNIFNDQRIEFAVDINPHKQGMFVPGTGQRIVKPDFLSEYKPDFVLLANPAYEEEIKRILAELKINVKFLSI